MNPKPYANTRPLGCEIAMPELENINSARYWDRRFASGDWQAKGGPSQTARFAKSQVPKLQLSKTFDGTLVDFGCGTGDAFPIYRNAYPNARLVGIDFSSEAIRLCRAKYHGLGEFIRGDSASVPDCNVVIVSNVLEHLTNDTIVVDELLKRCQRLFIVVPYEERELCEEHVRTYDYRAFSDFPVKRREIFASKGWSEFGLANVFGIQLGNLIRGAAGLPPRRRRLQIMFEIRGMLSPGLPA